MRESQTDSLPHDSSANKLGMNICIGWGLGYLGLAALLQAISSLILKYMVDILGVAAALAGVVIAATRLFDAVIDPAIGSLGDRTNSRLGRRRPYLLFGAFACAFVPILVFVLPVYVPGAFQFTFISAALLIYAIAYTIFNVPHLSMPVEMTQDPAERTRLFTFRMYGFALGYLVGGAFAPWLVGKMGETVLGYQAMGLVVGTLVFAACFASFRMTGAAPYEPVDMARQRPKLADVLSAFGNRPFLVLLAIKVFLITGVAVSTGGLAFFFVSVMDRSLTIYPYYGVSLTIGMMICQPVWLAVSRRVGKRNCYISASILYATVLASFLLSGPEEHLYFIALRGLALGFTAGGAMLMSQSMLPDVIQFDIDRTGQRNEGILTGLFSTAERTSSAIGVAIGGGILSLGGYISGSAAAIQPESAIKSIYVVVGIAPMTGVLMSIVAALFYNLDNGKR